MSRFPRLLLATLLVAPLAIPIVACNNAGVGESAWSSVPRETRGPQGKQALLSLPENEVIDAIGWASLEIEDQRRQGVESLIGQLQVELAGRGIDVSALATITADYVASAPDLRGYTAVSSSSAALSSSSAAVKRFALGEPGANHQYLRCPLQAPDASEGTRCEDLVDSVLARVRQDIEAGRPSAEQAYAQDFARLSEPARQFIAQWAHHARDHGAQQASVHAVASLRDAGICDDASNPRVVAEILGHQEGVSLVLSQKSWAEQQVTTCAINTDEIAEQVRMMARSGVSEHVIETTICAGDDFAKDNDQVEVLNDVRRQSILKGIDDQVLVLKQALLRKRQALPCDGSDDCLAGSDAQCDVGAQCDVAGCGAAGANDSRCLPDGAWERVDGRCMCCRTIQRENGRKGCRGRGWSSNIYCKQQQGGQMFCQCGFMPLGSPLAIDLDGDGLRLTGEKVDFDLLGNGGLQQATWVGAREALLAIDRDGDGRIGSGVELFGDQSPCDHGRCYDGVEALRRYDAKDHGGNGDGVIDRRDRVFGRLRLWVDGDQDGSSDAGELSTLAERGIVALKLAADYRAERRAEGSISARLEVVTDEGPRTAYDVWFKLDGLSADDLRSFLPR